MKRQTAINEKLMRLQRKEMTAIRDWMTNTEDKISRFVRSFLPSVDPSNPPSVFPSCRSYPFFFFFFRMGSVASSISGVEKQLEEQTALHLEFEQRKVRTEGDLCVNCPTTTSATLNSQKENVFNWRGERKRERECKSELMMRNITLTDKRKLTWQHSLLWLHVLHT